MASFRRRSSRRASYNTQDYSDYSFSSDVAVRDTKQRIAPDLDESPSSPVRSTVSFRFRSLEAEHVLAAELSSQQQGSSASAPAAMTDTVTRELSFADGTFLSSSNLDGASTVSRSRLSAVTVYESTLPMAFDNDRFFDADQGYHDALERVLSDLMETVKRGKRWRAGNTEISWLGGIWRWVLRVLLQWTLDSINRLLLARGPLLDYLNFISVYESFVLGSLITAVETDSDDANAGFSWQLAMHSRNVSRIIVQIVRNGHWDWFFHTHTQLHHRRLFDILGWLPWIGRFCDPPSENHASSRWFALYNLWDTFLELFRWHNDDVHNLTPEATGFEQAVCDHFGTYFGRKEFNQFRTEHRLTIDESIVRSFVSTPALTLRNNGIEHVLRCVSGHWREMVQSEYGNFAHQRMELLHPFEAIRYHLPATLHVLANLRGRNVWDSRVLAPLVRKLQTFDPAKIASGTNKDDVIEEQNDISAPCLEARRLVQEVQDTVVDVVCASIPTRMEPLNNWLAAIKDALEALQEEAEALRSFLSSIHTGNQLGYQLLKTIDWSVPSEAALRVAIVDRILRRPVHPAIPVFTIDRALEKLAPKDERTLRECVQQNRVTMLVAKLLVQQTVRLLERELQRHAIDERIRALSQGPRVEPDSLERTRWYWVDAGNGFHICLLSRTFSNRLKFVRIDSNDAVLYDKQYIRCHEYIPIAEAISRAQKAYMTIEIDHCKRFSYTAFMEFGRPSSQTSLRSQLRRLITVSQICCQELDNARLNTLTEIRTSVSKRRQTSTTVEPQNVVVIGGGPTGLLCAIHSLQNTLLSGGSLKLFEGRGGKADLTASAFERAQIVRLDARQISMLRYHLGVSFEDVFIPLRGDTEVCTHLATAQHEDLTLLANLTTNNIFFHLLQAHLGNAIPSQQFVEVTIKRLESMLLDEVVRLRSSNLLDFFSDSKIQYDASDGVFRKGGKYLKVGDKFRLHGESVLIESLNHQSSLDEPELSQGVTYEAVLPQESKVRRFKLESVDNEAKWYVFVEEDTETTKSLTGNFEDLPPLYHTGEGRIGPSSFRVNTNGTLKEIPYDSLEADDLKLDFSGSHVAVALGKPAKSPTHFKVVTEEPYAVCCIEGAKVTTFMHRFGVPRFRLPIVDDYLSQHLHNTRVLGDFRKSVRVKTITNFMRSKLSSDQCWKHKIEKLTGKEGSIGPALLRLVLQESNILAQTPFRRERLQCRLFELGNNYYLGMELPREFEAFKTRATTVAFPTNLVLQAELANLMDRLWFESTMESIATSHAIPRRERRRIPQFYTVDCPFNVQLGTLPCFEAFHFSFEKCKLLQKNQDGIFTVDVGLFRVMLPGQTVVFDTKESTTKCLSQVELNSTIHVEDNFEVIECRRGAIGARTSGGHLVYFPRKFVVRRASNLSRSPDGYSESKVSLAAFPVAHTVSNRTVRVSGEVGPEQDVFITAYVGDAQASPHFMRYSGLTGACINCASFNSLLGQAFSGTRKGCERAQRYAFETQWSNSEVVRRGTGLCHGFDAFLRPGFTYDELVSHLYDRAQEHFVLGATTVPLLQREWKVKLAASLVPRGIEIESLFYESLLFYLSSALRQKFEDVIKQRLNTQELSATLVNAVADAIKSLTKRWKAQGTISVPAGNFAKLGMDELEILTVTTAELELVADALISSVHCAFEMKLLNLRFTCEIFNQPDPLDAFSEFHSYTQANSFQSKLFIAVVLESVGIPLYVAQEASVLTVFLFALSYCLSLWGIADLVRVRDVVRTRLQEFASKTKCIRKALFSSLEVSIRKELGAGMNPFLLDIEEQVTRFETSCEYYGEEENDAAIQEFMASEREVNNVMKLMKGLATTFIPGTFQRNSYIQEDLVALYGALDDFLRFLLLDEEELPSAPSERALGHDHVATYVAFLEMSKLDASALSAVSVWFNVSRVLHSLDNCGRSRPHEKERNFARRDLESTRSALRWLVARKSVALLSRPPPVSHQVLFSIMITCGMLLTGANLVFIADLVTEVTTGGPLVGVTLHGLVTVAFIVAIFGSVQSIIRAARRLFMLVFLEDNLNSCGTTDRRLILRLIRLESVISLAKILVALTITFVLFGWSGNYILGQGDNSLDALPSVLLLRLSFGAGCAVVFIMLLQLWAEFSLRYNLSPSLGPSIHSVMVRQFSSSLAKFPEPRGIRTETQAQLQLLSRNYAVQDFLLSYRLDTILDHDRYSSILHYLRTTP